MSNLLNDLILAPSDRLSIQLDDLRDYYYLLRWPGNHVAGGAIVLPVRAVEPDAAGAVGCERHEACLVVAAMGDAKVPDLAHLVHQWVLRRRGLLDESRSMHYGHPPPVDHVWEGVYIEDRAVVGIVRGRHAEEDRTTIRDLVSTAEVAYRDAGLVRHSAKEVRDAEAATIWAAP